MGEAGRGAIITLNNASGQCAWPVLGQWLDREFNAANEL